MLDLLDEDVFLDSDSSQNLWESEVFDTGQFNVVGLTIRGEAVAGSIVCYTAWQLVPGDEFLLSSPLRTIDAPGVRPPIGFLGPGMIQGLRAKISCSAEAAVGNDPPPFPSGTLTDVKVLLRRE